MSKDQSEKTASPPELRRTGSSRRNAFVCLLVALLIWSYPPFQTNRLPTEYALCSESGSIYTVDENNPKVECILVGDLHIKDTGSIVEIKVRRAKICLGPSLVCLFRRLPWVSELKEFRLDPKFIVVPGLADAHAHILGYGFKMNLQLDGSLSVPDVIQRLDNYVLRHPDILNDTSRWIEGMGWDQTKWAGKEFPSAEDFETEPLLKDRPICLERVDGHAAWVSKRVLELMGELPDQVKGGIIVRDKEGNPTGVFVDNAMALIPRPPWDERALSEYYNVAMTDALSHGLTSIHDAGSPPEHIQFFKRHAELGTLPIRVYMMGLIDSGEYWGDKIPRLVDHGKGGLLNVRSIKLVMDGALGSWGAALLEPYSDNPSTSGIMRFTEEKIKELVTQFWKDGWQVNVHCIGDRANKAVLDVFEEILVQGGNASTWRPRIEHAQIMRQSDLERTGRLSVIASVQPTHATSDMGYAESRLGPERIRGAYAYQTLLQSSPQKILPIGSDFPVESINPLLGFYAAISRLSPDGQSPHGEGGWYPEERLTRAQALKGMTLDAAYASFAEHEIGSLEPGKKADYVVLDQDIMTIAVKDILSTRVTATVVDGRLLYGGL